MYNLVNYYIVLIEVLIIAVLAVRQLQVRRVTGSPRCLLVPMIFLVMGMPALSYVESQQVPFLVLQLLIASVLGALRSLSVKIWNSADGLKRKGNVFTLLLWFLFLLSELSLESIGHYSYSPAFLDLGTSLLSQRVVLIMRSKNVVGYG